MILRYVVMGSVAVLVLDTLASFAARLLAFDYALLSSVSMILYGAIGFAAQKHLSLGSATVAAVGVGAVDATIGWLISSAILPPVPEVSLYPPIPTLAVIAFVVALAASCGFAGALLRRIIRPSPLADA